MGVLENVNWLSWKTALVCRVCHFHDVFSPTTTDFFLPTRPLNEELRRNMHISLASSGQEPAQGTFNTVIFRERLSGKYINSGLGVVKQLCS